MDMKLHLTKIIEAGIAAPSIDNCQPWFFTLDDDSINIYLDKERAEFFGDYNFTASYVTLGAVIENMVIAADQFGFECNVIPFPDVKSDSLIATLKFCQFDKKDNILFPFIQDRCTNRKKYHSSPLTEEVIKELSDTSLSNGALLYLSSDKTVINNISSLSAAVDKIIFEHKLLHFNLFKWTRWSFTEAERTRDGMPIECLELSFSNRIVFRIISSWAITNFLNCFGLSWIIGKMNSGLLKKSSAVGMIVMKNSSNIDYLNGGRFFERIWLKASSLGLAFHPYGGLPFLLTRILQAKNEGFSSKHYQKLLSIYSKLCKLFPITDNNAMIILFRLGYAESPKFKSPRRPLSQVIKKDTII